MYETVVRPYYHFQYLEQSEFHQCMITDSDILEDPVGTLRLKCDGTRAETRFRLSAKRTSPFKSIGSSVQSTTGSRVVRISGGTTG